MAKDELLEKIYQKQEHLSEEISDIKVTLAKQEENLRLHMYRTELAEKSIEILKEELKPVKAHVILIQGVAKYLGLSSIFVSLVFTVFQIIKILN